MTRSESITHLATALAQAQAEMPVAVFDATNPFLKSKYASLGAVIQASRPILAKHKLSLVQFPIGGPNLGLGNGTNETDGTNAVTVRGDARPGTDYIGVESILTHESGEFISERIVIALTEEKGKSRVQSAGSTLTYLRRYSWASILGMYSDEDSDGCVPHGPMAPGQPKQGKPLLPPPPLSRAKN